ncbi:SWI/SNF-related matrix-associated actin-dependent regulator of chromatin subfamily A containing DEAD/H box 1 homolog [Leptinotarsa decemlineata]|uniref:SWI/SNF-related matrix-associated actin-dependent regulator of chromatin subfamily A containing DEAD/H box 1 homolog n=1 Tax=Leptinotarsa decemlineata TaxID=7539 RepID=UPI000C25229B|nr:SWI/SNF-related matrix-associated actin-dependent regulator of chromatin subfamily A containing DEAD/H box 1 homolog [Leptinotarsa decemlineata]
MAEEDSPNLQKLRGFRYQKKSQISHQDSSDVLSSSGEDIKSREVVRKRIIVIPSDSDSELETVATEQKSSKLIAAKNSDVQTQEQSSQEVVGNNSKSEIQGVVVNHSSFNSKYNGFSQRAMKNPSILEKEKQMKFLLEIFPNLEAMKIHDCLSKHSFNTDAAAAELSRSYNKQSDYTGYDEWKQDYDRKFEESKQLQLTTNGLFDRTQSFKRQATEEPTKKKKAKRRKSYDSDDSTGSNNYKDKRVFDSDEDSDVEISNELTGDKKRVLEFFETATVNELQLMNSCSKKKAEAIIESRPFVGWIDLVEKLQTNKLSTDLLNAAQQVLTTRNNIKHLMKKCTNLAQQLERAVAAGAGVKEQPRTLSSSLKLTGYQMVGLNWLVVLYSQGVNGILADEMGLGKTVQIISFLAHLKEIGAASSTHLVIVPSSTLDNWKNEFARWCPELRIFMYYGSTEERRQFRIDLAKGMLSEFDVILTTYTMVGNSPEERKMFRVTRMHYVIFDEAHMLKNMNTQRYENLIRINAKHRILLTGTPLQNNLLELMSLLIFVMPKIFAEKTDDLKSLFQKNSKKDQDDSLPTFEREQIEQAKRIMKPFVLRRLKCDVLKDLPKKTDFIVTVPMVPSQKENYEHLVASYKNIDENGKNTYSGMSIMSDLRKLCNHPLLMRYHYDLKQLQDMARLLAADPGYKDTVVQYIVDDLTWMSDFELHTLSKDFRCLNRFKLPDTMMLTSGKFSQLDKMLPELKENGHRVLIFSQYVIMLNIVEEYLRIRNHKFLRLDGSTAVQIRQDLINEFTEDTSYFVFLLSTRAGGLGINLTSADTVIIHDIDFNPYNDKQAEDRCHRMGQSKPVTVYRFISQGSIEEGMLEMNKEKLKLERDITTEESDNPDVKSVVRLLSSALGIDSMKATSLVTPPKKKP